MKGYKAFEKGMICRGKQYAENTVFEEEKAEICKSGIHFCKNPFDVLNYYPLVMDNGDLVEIAEVEALDEAQTTDNIKFCTKKLKVGAKLSFKAFIEAGINFIFEKTKKEIKKDEVSSATSGIYSHSATSGDNSNSATSGRYSHSATSGFNSNSATSGDNSNSATSGRYSNSAALGDDSSSQVNNTHGVSIAVGYNSKAKAIKGSAIVVCERGEWNGEGYPLIDIKSAIVDGEKLKADTWYTLKNGEFIEVDEDE